MTLRKQVIGLTMVFAFATSTAFSQTSTKPPSTASKTKAAASTTKPAKDHVVQGSVVAITNDTLTIRGTNKKDQVFMIDSGTQKPASLAAGSKITVHYKDESNKHIATSILAAK